MSKVRMWLRRFNIAHWIGSKEKRGNGVWESERLGVKKPKESKHVECRVGIARQRE